MVRLARDDDVFWRRCFNSINRKEMLQVSDFTSRAGDLIDTYELPKVGSVLMVRDALCVSLALPGISIFF